MLTRRSILASLAALALPWRKKKAEAPSTTICIPFQRQPPRWGVEDSFIHPGGLDAPIVICGYPLRDDAESVFFRDFGRAQAEKLDREILGGER